MKPCEESSAATRSSPEKPSVAGQGALEPDAIHLPGVFVNRMILGAPYDKKIEFRTVREREDA